MNKKSTWSNGESPLSTQATRLGRERQPEAVTDVELRGDVPDYSVNQIKRNMFDVKSFGLYSQDIPEVKDLAIGDTFEVPHFVYTPYSDRESRGRYDVCNAEFKVLDKKTVKRVTEVLDADKTKFGKRTVVTSYVKLECTQDRHQGPDTWFERCSNFSARKEGGGYYYPLKKKKQLWVSQKEIFMMFLKDGGLCPLVRNGRECKLCA
jgi:hypothetical protein